VLLLIESNRVKSEIRHEGAEGGEIYPHIYDHLNIDAVTSVLEFEPKKDGTFELPRKLHVL